jgi:hypothetical protein
MKNTVIIENVSCGVKVFKTKVERLSGVGVWPVNPSIYWLAYSNRSPASKHAPHQNTLERVVPTTTKYTIFTPKHFVSTRQ